MVILLLSWGANNKIIKHCLVFKIHTFFSPENKIQSDKNDKTEAVQLRTHHEKAGFLGKTIPMGKIQGRKKRVRPNMTTLDCM